MKIYIKNKLKTSLRPFIILTVLAFFVFSSLPALAADEGVNKALEGLNKSGSVGFDNKESTEGPNSVTKDIPTAIGQVIGAALAFIGVLFFILIIYGGFLWMTARGNEQQVVKAKDLITAAVIGLIIVLGAYAITSYIGNSLQG